MSKTPQDLFAALQPGDLLMVPVTLPSSKEQRTVFAAVLRTGNEGELYLSALGEDRPDSRPNHYNPHRWSGEKNALVDRDGDVPRWYSVDIQLERRGAAKVAEAYTAIPRLEHFRHPWNDGELKRFLEKDPRATILNGIVANGEAGSVGQQLSFALDVMGVAHDKEQAIGLATFVEHLAARAMLRAAMGGAAIVIDIDRRDPKAEGEGKK